MLNEVNARGIKTAKMLSAVFFSKRPSRSAIHGHHTELVTGWWLNHPLKKNIPSMGLVIFTYIWLFLMEKI